MLDRLSVVIKDRRVLVVQYLKRTAERGGLYWEYAQGIPLGCSLSPIIGAFFLNELDRYMERLRLFYVRFMGDIVVLAPTRRWLRKAVKLLNQVLASLGLEKHPGKTFIGRIKKGFDFLGYHFRPDGLGVAKETLVRFFERATRLYEREGRGPDAAFPLGAYVRRCVRANTVIK